MMQRTHMPSLYAIVGKKKSGKTTTLVRVAAELTARGWTVASIKHSHGFTSDREGSDSWRHRHDGKAIRTVLASDAELAVFGGWPADTILDAPEIARRYLADADVVLVEGFRGDAVPTIEVFQSGRHAEPWYASADAQARECYLAIASDDGALAADCPVLELNDEHLPVLLADIIEDHIGRIARTRNSLSIAKMPKTGPMASIEKAKRQSR